MKPLVNSAPLLALGPIVRFSEMVLPFVLIILSSPILGPPPPTSSHPGDPGPLTSGK